MFYGSYNINCPLRSIFYRSDNEHISSGNFLISCFQLLPSLFEMTIYRSCVNLEIDKGILLKLQSRMLNSKRLLADIISIGIYAKLFMLDNFNLYSLSKFSIP